MTDARPTLGAGTPTPTNDSRSWARLARCSATEAHFLLARPARAPVLVSPLVLALAALPWLAGDLTGLTFATSLAFALLATALVARGRPRRVRARLDHERRELCIEGRCVRLDPEATWSLGIIPPGLHFPDGGFEASLGPVGGQSFSLLRHRDPSQILHWLHRLERQGPVPVRGGWSLPAGVRPWQFDSALEPTTPRGGEPSVTPRTLVESRMGSRGLRVLIAVLALLVTADLFMLVVTEGARVAQVAQVHFVSLLLPALMASFLIALALGLLSHRDRLRLDGRLSLATHSFGRRRLRGAVSASAVRGVHVIGASDSARRHLLVDSREGPLSIVVETARASEAAHRARLALDCVDAPPPAEPGEHATTLPRQAVAARAASGRQR